MVAARSVTVKLKLDSSAFNRGLAEAAASANAFQKALHDDSGRTVFSSSGDDAKDFSTSVDEGTGSLQAFRKELAGGSRDSDRFGKGISASNSHMALLVQYAVALGPALVPALAAAVPLTAALGSGLAVASVGAGVAVLAFQGVGDALKAMNDFAIDPTEAHLKALNQAMDTLGPAGQNFVVFLQDLRPEIQKLQNLAQEGLFPGLQDGIESVLTQMPLVQSVITTVATAMGNLAREGGEALTSPFWTDFFTYIRDDATGIITNFSVGFAKLFEGISALVMDFGPLTNDIAAGFANMGRAFSDWAQGLPATEGFQQFVQYLRDTGPQILDTLAHLGKALLDVGVALSGLPAQASLAILNTLASVLSAIASSPIGPGLLAAAVGIAAITRAIGAWDTVQASAMMQFFGGKGVAGKGGLAGIGSLATVSNVTKVAGAVSLLALSMTGLGDAAKDAGVSGLVTGASVGAIFGPWGAAAGAAAGSIMDAVHANDAMNDSIEAQIGLTQQAQSDDPLDFAAQEKHLEALKARATALQFLIDKLGSGQGSNEVQRLQDVNREIEDFKLQQDALKDVLQEVAVATGGPNALEKYGSGLQGLGQIADDIQPALDHLGITLDDLRDLRFEADRPGTEGDAARDRLQGIIEKIADYTNALQTVPGKEKAVGEALAALGAGAGNAQADIDALSAALDSLFSPALDYSQAMDDWRQGLADLAADLKGSTLDPNTTIGRGNRDVIRERVQGLIDVLNAAAANGAGPAQLTKRLMTMREQIIAAGKAAHLNGKDLRDFLATLNLTPKDIRIIIRQFGAEKVKADAKDLANDIKKIPKDVLTDIKANGVSADATVKSLMAKYDGLSKKDATTILKARDAASPLIALVLKHLKGLERDFTARVSVDTGAAIGQIAGVLIGLNRIDNTHATATVSTTSTNTTINRTLTRRRPKDGGLILGPGGPREDKIPAMISNGEFVVNAAATARNLDLLFEMNAQKFADGGQAGRQISASDIGRRATRSDLSFMRDLEHALNRMRHEAREAEHAENLFRHARERAREATHRLADIEKRLEQAQSKEHVNAKEVYRLKQLEIAQRRKERDAIKEQTQAEKEATKERDQATKAAEKWKQLQQELVSQAQSIAQAVTEQGAIFGGQGTSLTVGGILAKLRAANEDAGKFRHYINQLRGMGLDERIIQQLLEQGPTPEGVTSARNLAHAGVGQIQNINRQERQLVGVAASTGALGVRGGAGINVTMNINKVETQNIREWQRAGDRIMRRAVRVAISK